MEQLKAAQQEAQADWGPGPTKKAPTGASVEEVYGYGQAAGTGTGCPGDQAAVRCVRYAPAPEEEKALDKVKEPPALSEPGREER